MNKNLQCFSTQNALIEEHYFHTITYGRWSRTFGVWTAKSKATSGSTTDDLPTWPLFGQYGVTVFQNKAIPNHLFSAYVEEIPYNFRRFVAPLGRWQWVALEAIWLIPEFAKFLESETKERKNSFLEVCYILANVQSLSSNERMQFNLAIMYQKRRKTLSDLTSENYGNQMVRNLSKIDTTNLSKVQLEAIMSIFSNKEIADQISHLDKISESLVRILERSVAWRLEPKTICLISRIYQNKELYLFIERGLHRLFSRLEHKQGKKGITNIKENFALSKGIPEFRLILRAWSALDWDSYSFPSPSTLGNKKLIPITSLKEVIEECIRENGLRRSLIQYRYELFEPDHYVYYYKWLGDEPATVVLGIYNPNVDLHTSNPFAVMEPNFFDVMEPIEQTEFSLLEVVGKTNSILKPATLNEIKIQFLNLPIIKANGCEGGVKYDYTFFM